MAQGGENIFSHQGFVITLGFIVQLSKNDTLPCAILVDPNVFQNNIGSYLMPILGYFNSFENPSASTS